MTDVWAGAVTRLSSVAGRARLRRAGITVGDALTCYGLPVVTRHDGSSIAIGDRVVLCSRSTHTALGVSHAVVLRTLRDGARLSIGDDVGISGASICAALAVTIGAGTLLGADVIVTDTDFHPVESRDRRHAPIPEPLAGDEVVVGANVFVGARAILLRGARVGDGSVIGAGSVVTGEVPGNVVAAGNPARVLREIG